MKRLYAFKLFAAIAVLNVAGGHAADAAWVQQVKPFLTANCFDCHDADTHKSGLDLSAYSTDLKDAKVYNMWVRIHDRVRDGEMPPAKHSRPAPEKLKAFTGALAVGLTDFDKVRDAKEGRVVLRRLNRVEYENTLHDLLDIEVPLQDILPEDATTDGFDNVGDGLHLSAIQMEKYLEAADTALDAAIRLTRAPDVLKARYFYKDEQEIRRQLDKPPPNPNEKDRDVRARQMQTLKVVNDAIVIFSDGYAPTTLRQFNPRAAGQYRIKVAAFAHQSNDRPVVGRVYSSRQQTRRMLAYFDFPPEGRVAEFTTFIDRDQLSVNPFECGWDSEGRNVNAVGGADKFTGSGLALQWVEIEGPLHEVWPPESVKRVFGDLPVTPLARPTPLAAFEVNPPDAPGALRRIVASFAARAFRRPLENQEAEPYIALGLKALESRAGFVPAVRVVLKSILSSPEFLFFRETPGALDDYALASRLSYFLWTTQPDAELLKLAEQKKLHTPEVLRGQIDRLLKSPRARAFIKNFTGQWLDLRQIDATMPDMQLYPEFDELLKAAMIDETELFFGEILANDLDIKNFITSNFTMLNRRLASHYGIPGTFNETFRKVDLPKDSHRGGLLTQASVLKVSANGTVTSPVLRGAWVLKRIFGKTPPPPPADAGAIEPDTRGATTVREQLAKHRRSESCIGCHTLIDPPGFALESFDVIGGWRDWYRSAGKGETIAGLSRGRRVPYRKGPAVDSTGQLPNGKKFANIDEFKHLLLDDADQLARALAGKLTIFATGGVLSFHDRERIEELLKKCKKNGQYGLRSLVQEVILSPVFLNK